MRTLAVAVRFLLVPLGLLDAAPAGAVDGNVVKATKKINDVVLGGVIQNGSRGGLDVEGLGDVNGDGHPDIAFGAWLDDSGSTDRGAIHLLFLDANGNPLAPSTIEFADGMNDPLNVLNLENSDQFGTGIEFLGDFDGDGNLEIAVGAINADPGVAPSNSGAVHLLDIDPDTWQLAGDLVIASGTTNFTTLDASDALGFSIAGLGDWDGDGGPEIAVAATGDDDGVTDNGSLYILYLKPDGTGVKTYMKLSDTQGGFDGVLDADASNFGRVTAIGDLDGDGQVDLAVGAPVDGAAGAAWVVFMDPACQTDTTVVPHPTCTAKPGSVKIAPGSGGFTGPLGANAGFGIMVAWLPDGVPRLAVGAYTANGSRGEVWLLNLAPDGTVVGEERIGSQQNWNVTLGASDGFGVAVAPFGDLDGDGVTDLLAGAYGDDDGASDTGAVYLLTLDACPTIVTNPIVFDSPNDDGVNLCVPTQDEDDWQTLHLYMETGPQVSANPLDVCRNDLSVGDEVCAFDVRIEVEPPYQIWSFAPASGLYHTNGPPYPTDELRINWVEPATPTNPAAGSVKLGDLTVVATAPGGVVRLSGPSAAVGAKLDLQVMSERTILLPEPEPWLGLAACGGLLAVLARWRARRHRDGILGILAGALVAGADPASAELAVKRQVNVGQDHLNPYFNKDFGTSLASLGPFSETPLALVVGDQDDSSVGRLWIVFFDRYLAIRGHQVISGDVAGIRFGHAVANAGDLDQDGVVDVLVGARLGGTSSHGSIRIVRLDAEGREKLPRKVIDNTTAGVGPLDASDQFGHGVAGLGDVDGDGLLEIAVGAIGDDDGGISASGAAYILSIDPATRDVVYQTKLSAATAPLNGLLTANDWFGSAVVGLGDLDGPGGSSFAIGVGAQGDVDCLNQASCNSASEGPGSVYVLFLQGTGAGGFTVFDHQKISETQGGLPFTLPTEVGGTFGRTLAWDPIPDGGGMLYVGGGYNNSGANNTSSAPRFWPLHIRPDGTVRDAYQFSHYANVGFMHPSPTHYGRRFGNAIAVLGDVNGDEVSDLVVADQEEPGDAHVGTGGFVFLFERQDDDRDGLDDVIDNCPNASNRLQEDTDGDKVGDVCDNCSGVANANQADADADGEGNACEPVELVLETTGTPAAPAWDLKLQCGTYHVTDLAGAIVLPAGATNPKTLSLTGTSIGTSSVSGPGLVSPGGVRGDAIYFEASGNGSPDNRLCTALSAPVTLGTLTTGPISGTQLAAAALTIEGVGTPGFENELAETAGGPVPITGIRFVNAAPLPKLDLELGPAIVTGGGTRWEVCIPRADYEFHRVAFGLIAPAGTDASEMRWVGCDTTPDGNGERSCTGGTGFGATVAPAGSFTVGPQASPPGTQVPHTLYVSLEGSRLSSADLFTLNFVGEGVCLGAVELDTSPDLEPALTADGLETLGVTPFELADSGEDPIDPGEVKLIGKFNPADDVDGDNVQDLGDNCPFIANTSQVNRGSFDSDVDESDPLGDACQCGESSDDGAVLDPDDYDDLRAYLSGQITNPLVAQRIEERCSVANTTECNVLDLLHLRLALDGVLTGVETRCDAALAPASP